MCGIFFFHFHFIIFFNTRKKDKESDWFYSIFILLFASVNENSLDKRNEKKAKFMMMFTSSFHFGFSSDIFFPIHLSIYLFIENSIRLKSIPYQCFSCVNIFFYIIPHRYCDRNNVCFSFFFSFTTLELKNSNFQFSSFSFLVKPEKKREIHSKYKINKI